MNRYVYGLSVEGDTIRYIGKADDLDRRLKEHIYDALTKTRTHKRYWLRAALDAERAIQIEVLETVPTSSEAFWLERLWIAVFRACGVPLTNSTAGGDGGAIPARWADKSPERMAAFRERMRAAALKRAPMSAEVRAVIAAKKRGQKHSAETKALMAQSQKERWLKYTPAERAERKAAAAAGGGYGSTAAARKGAAMRWNKE